jgi:hypothetical protein
MKPAVDLDVPCQCVLQVVVWTPEPVLGAIGCAAIVLSQFGMDRLVGQVILSPAKESEPVLGTSKGPAA